MIRIIAIITALFMITNMTDPSLGNDMGLDPSHRYGAFLSLNDHVPIDINNDTAMLELVISESLMGNGTNNDPFIIEGLSIDAQGGSYCIRIFDVTYSVLIRDCDLLNTSMAPNNIFNAMSALELSGNAHITIVNLTFLYSGLGIRSSGNERIFILNSTFKNMGHGTYVTGSELSSINNCVYTNLTGYGIYKSYDNSSVLDNHFNAVSNPVYILRSNSGTISGNLVEDGGGMNFESCNYLLIQNNTVNSSSGMGYRFVNTHDSIITGNLASKCVYGFYISNSDRNDFINIRSVNNDDNGFMMFYSDHCVIEEGVIHSNTNGIYMYSCHDNLIASSSIRFNKNDGIRATSSNRNDIVGNFISYGLENGISFMNSHTLKVKNNHVQNNNLHGLKLTNVRYSEITGNLIEKHQDALNLERTSYNMISHNSVFDPYNGLYMFSSIEDTVYSNIIDSCRNHAMILSETSDVVVRNNSIQKNRFYGLYLFNSMKTTAINNAFLENNGAGTQINVSRIQASCVNSPAIFNDTSGGNYWRDHVSPDDDEDGIVDLPYPVSGGNPDGKPLAEPPFKVVPGAVNDPSCVSYQGPVLLNYTSPKHDGGSPILGYRIYRNDGGTIKPYKDVDENVHEIVDEDVINGWKYQYRISSLNEIGESILTPIIFCISDSSSPSAIITKPIQGSILSSSSLVISWESFGDPWENEPPLSDLFVDGNLLVGEFTGNSYRIDDISEGAHLIELDSFDRSGNHNITSVEVFIDTISPNISIVEPMNGSYFNRTDIEVTYHIEETGSGLFIVRYGLEGGIHFPVPVESPFILDDLFEGKHILSIEAEDLAGNINEGISIFFIDLTPPELTILDPRDGHMTNSDIIKVNLEHSDTLSGISSIVVTVNGLKRGHFPPTNEITIEDLEEGVNTILITAVDKAGNSISRYVDVYRDTVIPTIIDHGPMNGDNQVNETIFAEFSENMNRTTVRFQISDNVGYLFWSGNKAILNTDIPLKYNTTYRITVNGKDHSGNSMIPFSWDFTTTDKGWIKGIVLDERRMPIENSIISIGGHDDVMTGPDGVFEISVGSGTYNIGISHEGYGSIFAEIVVKAGGATDMGVITLRESEIRGHVEGRVVDWMGNPILGAVITSDTTETETTDKDGFFRMELTSGEHILFIYREGYQNTTVSVTVNGTQTTLIEDIILQSLGENGSDDGSINESYILLIFIAIMIAGSLILYLMTRRRKKTSPLPEE